MIFKGVHATCVTFAKNIKANGLRASSEGRAGSGAYLWSYVHDSSEAEMLAQDWYEDHKAQYTRQPAPGMAILFFEIDLDSNETVNINSVNHHELIRKKVGKLNNKATLSKAYDDHIGGLAEIRKKSGIELKLVEASVPYPVSSKDRKKGPPLTASADAYIILPPGLPQLRLVGARGIAL